MLHIRRLSVMVLLVAFLAGACQPVTRPPAQEPQPPHGIRPDAPPYAERGPYAVGTQEFVVDDTDRPLPLTIWYPAQKVGHATEEITYTEDYAPLFPTFQVGGHAIKDAVPDTSGQPYPLVVFSHGNGFSRLQSVYLMEHLASHGFVVAAADHSGNNLAKLGEASYAWYIYRPQDIQRVVAYIDDLAAPAGALAGLIDTEHMAIMGHSFGASTALRYAGAPLDFGWCVKNVELEKSFANAYCEELLARQDELAKLAGLTDPPQAKWPALEDSRADAVVALAPDYDEWGSEYDSVAAIKAPALIIAGTQDTFNPPEQAAYPIYEHLGSTHKALVTLAGADHLVFANACSAAPAFATADWYFVCSDPVWDMDRAHDLVDHFVTAFLLAELKGDAQAAAALAPENVAFPGIAYKTTAD
jgi:predicted dienelactone hydrolase